MKSVGIRAAITEYIEQLEAAPLEASTEDAPMRQMQAVAKAQAKARCAKRLRQILKDCEDGAPHQIGEVPKYPNLRQRRHYEVGE